MTAAICITVRRPTASASRPAAKAPKAQPSRIAPTLKPVRIWSSPPPLSVAPVPSPESCVVRPDASEALDDLRERLAQPLRRLGLPTAAEWTPHLTLAHEANGAVPPADVAPVPWVASDFALVWSHRQPTAHYELLARYPAVGSGG